MGFFLCRSFQDASVHESLLLASGSADNFAYIFDVSGPSVSVRDHGRSLSGFFKLVK